MEEAADGTLFVFGTVTAEEVDLDQEICDYEGTKPWYEKRTKEQLAKTSIPGMEPSLMPFRQMHQLIVQGAGRSLVCDDAKKTIKMGFAVVDANAIKMWKAGCFVGFSQGGAYIKQWPDPEHEGCTRYIADPAEVSAVDSPALPSALVESMKGRTVTLQKASGSVEQVPLEIISLDKHRMGKMEREIEALTRLLKLKFPEQHRELTAREKAAISGACAKLALQKGLYEVGWLGGLIEELTWLCMQSEFERDMEGDNSKVPDGLREAWSALLEQFKAMAIEEADETAAAGGQGEKGMKITDQAGLTKAAKTIADHLDKHMEMHKALHEKLEGTLAKDHPILKASQAMMDHCEKCQKAAKDAGAGEEPEEGEKAAPVAVTGQEAILKAQGEKIDALTQTLADLTEKLSKTAAPHQNIPASGAPVPVQKSAPSAFDELVEAPVVTH